MESAGGSGGSQGGRGSGPVLQRFLQWVDQREEEKQVVAEVKKALGLECDVPAQIADFRKELGDVRAVLAEQLRCQTVLEDQDKAATAELSLLRLEFGSVQAEQQKVLRDNATIVDQLSTAFKGIESAVRDEVKTQISSIRIDMQAERARVDGLLSSAEVTRDSLIGSISTMEGHKGESGADSVHSDVSSEHKLHIVSRDDTHSTPQKQGEPAKTTAEGAAPSADSPSLPHHTTLPTGQSVRTSSLQSLSSQHATFSTSVPSSEAHTFTSAQDHPTESELRDVCPSVTSMDTILGSAGGSSSAGSYTFPVGHPPVQPTPVSIKRFPSGQGHQMSQATVAGNAGIGQPGWRKSVSRHLSPEPDASPTSHPTARWPAAAMGSPHAERSSGKQSPLRSPSVPNVQTTAGAHSAGNSRLVSPTRPSLGMQGRVPAMGHQATVPALTTRGNSPPQSNFRMLSPTSLTTRGGVLGRS